MSQAERIARIHFLLENTGQVTVVQLKQDFEVSRATVMRDFELMRDRLLAPIVYDPGRNAYVYDKCDPAQASSRKRRPEFSLPGIWLNANDAYALLTLVNVSGQLDPGGLMPHISALRRLLKATLGKRAFLMKGFHKKIKVDLPNLRAGDRSVVTRLSEGLVDEHQVVLTWRDTEDTSTTAMVSLQRFVLDADGWEVEFVIEADKMRRRMPLLRIVSCTLTSKAAVLLPEFESDPQADWRALRNICYRLHPDDNLPMDLVEENSR